MFSPKLLDHFEHPRNVGTIVDPDASATVENPACGDVLQLTLKLDGDCIGEILFQAKGCVASIACASALTTLVRGRSPAAARALTRNELVGEVDGLPPASRHASHLALETLADALDRMESSRTSAT